MLVIIRGAGDLATGIALRLKRAHISVIMTDIPAPTAIRRTVAFSQAIVLGETKVEDVTARRAETPEAAMALLQENVVPVLADPEGSCIPVLKPDAVVDAILAKKNLGTKITDAPVVVGVGPGFTAGVDCHAVVETMRGHTLGRVYHQGSALPNTGIPGLIGGFAGEPGIHALILGSGKVGRGALQVLQALGANCTVMARNMHRLRALSAQYNGRVRVRRCSRAHIAEELPKMDIVLNCVKWQKENKEFLITRNMLSLMEKGSVIVDISNDEPGAIETSRATTHEDPRYIVDGIVHYCVANIPGAVAHSASVAYAAQMLPLILSLLNDGEEETCIRDGYYRRALTIYRGLLTHEETSAVQGKPWVRPEEALGISGFRLDSAPRASDTRSAHFYSWAEDCGVQAEHSL